MHDLEFVPELQFPDGVDSELLECLWVALREAALSVPQGGHVHEKEGRGWDAVELRHVWCDRSVWEVMWGVHKFRELLREMRQTGQPLRNVTSVRLRGANHFVGNIGCLFVRLLTVHLFSDRCIGTNLKGSWSYWQRSLLAIEPV